MVPVPEECRMHWTVEDVRRMIESGRFESPERFELVEGLIREKMGPSDPPIVAVMLATRAFRVAFEALVDVASGIPIKLTDRSLPEPALVVTQSGLGRPPTEADCLCVIEVSDSPLRKDQTLKAALYARHAIPEYVILDVVSRRAEIRRKPNPEKENGGETLILQAGGEFAPLGGSGSIQVADLFGDEE